MLISASMLISPLAAKLCTRQGIDPATLHGSGPRGRIMASDVVIPTTASPRRGQTSIVDYAISPTRPEKDGYYIYDGEADMRALAEISLPIAVQCEKLLENRYSLFDYIVRAVVKACVSRPGWQDANGQVDVLLFECDGEKIAAIPKASNKSIFQLSREIRQSNSPDSFFYPHIIVCDAHTTREQVAQKIHLEKRPRFALLVRGNTPKADILAGRESISHFNMPYTFYATTTLQQAEANRIAARLHTLLCCPISLLLS